VELVYLSESEMIIFFPGHLVFVIVTHKVTYMLLGIFLTTEDCKWDLSYVWVDMIFSFSFGLLWA